MQQKIGAVPSLQKGDPEATAHVFGRIILELTGYNFVEAVHRAACDLVSYVLIPKHIINLIANFISAFEWSSYIIKRQDGIHACVSEWALSTKSQPCCGFTFRGIMFYSLSPRLKALPCN